MLYPIDDLEALHTRMILNLNQMFLYVKQYCEDAKDYWCHEKLKTFRHRIEKEEKRGNKIKHEDNIEDE